MQPQAFFRAVLWGILTVLVCGCSSRTVLVRGGPTPFWVDALPKKKGELCAVGYSGPTLYQQNCSKNAAENARANLAESISVKIRAITVDVSNGSSGYYNRDVFVEGSESVSQTVLNGSEIQSQWLDMQGQRGEQNGCHVLVCIDSSKPVDKFVESLENKMPPKTVEKVRENAEAAFAELEQAEQKRSPAPAAPAPAATPEKKPEPVQPPAEGTTPSVEGDKVQPETQTDKEDNDEATPAVRKIEIPSQ